MGLGCRSGGYLIYLVIASGLLLLEVLVWWLTHDTTHTPEDPLARVRTRLERHISDDNFARKNGITQGLVNRIVTWFRSRTFRDVVKIAVIRPGEIANTVWLTYIIFAQTFGSHRECSPARDPLFRIESWISRHDSAMITSKRSKNLRNRPITDCGDRHQKPAIAWPVIGPTKAVSSTSKPLLTTRLMASMSTGAHRQRYRFL